MSMIGSPIETSILQAAQAQQTASKARDRERAATERARRFQDLVELRVAGMEMAEAVRKLPQNDSEQAGAEHQAKDHARHLTDESDEHQRIDLQA